MSEILFINACVRENSRTLELAKRVLSKLSGEISEVNLCDTKLYPLDSQSLEKRNKACFKKDFSDSSFDLAKQFAKADCIVIAAPYWDLMFPAVLKTYLENISVSGITFYYSQQGMPIGLCNAKKLYYITTAGGFIGDNDYGCSYIKSLAKALFGIEDTVCFYAQGLDISPQLEEQAMEQAKLDIDKRMDTEC